MKYKCPSCGCLISDKKARSVKGRLVQGKKSQTFYRSCPECGKDSKFFNDAGERDSFCWAEFNDKGEPWNFVRDFKAHSFCPVNLAQCENTACFECVYELSERKRDRGRYDCPQRHLFEKSDKPIQPTIFSFSF
jgi:hypothetical protein